MVVSRTLMITEIVTLTDSEEFPSAFMKTPSCWILFPSSVLFRILTSLPPHPALTSALPKCLCPLGCASSPAISQLTNQAAGQPEWDQRGGDASVLGAWVTGCFISVVTKGCVGTGGGTSAQFNVSSSTHFMRGWWWKGKDSSILLCIFKSITETVN